ncbi:retention module-containing protein [Pontibacterium granulatum]|uniref:retention module-containing protein n=1 Tax=Pontibacterium granulatum TaxID=2036029 RepID=UPI00249A1670|nr:retention module-containing protein [Pontibacterium granulatum]MDI3325437.1 retention module-containing protein [Pontibacterium granulatum]
MSNHTPIATVKAVTGEVFVRNAEGQSRLLKVGDQLKAGDVILPSAGRADLEMVDGTEMTFSEPVEVTLSPEMLSDQTALAEEESITDPTVAALLSALEAGEDPTQVLPAPAAGPGAAGGEGHSFVRLARIVENVEGLGFGGQGFTQFLFDFDTPDLINLEEGQPPVAAPDSASVDEDGSVLIDVLGNDTDADGDLDPSTVTITSLPSNGTVVVDSVTGAVTYTPNDNYNGPDSFQYTVQDADGNTSNPATVTIEVTPVAEPPVAVNDQVSTDEDSPIDIDVLANDEDPDGEIDPTTVTIVTQPDHGTASVDPDTGVVTYTPDENYNGPDSFQYTVQDDEGNTSSPATVNITVDPVADNPVAADDNVTTDEDVAVTIDVLANDTDLENDIDPTTVVIQSGPSNGSVAVDLVTGEVTYTPDGDYNGPDSFTYTVKDATGLESNVATVNITVDPVADKPVATDDNVTTDEDVAVTIDVLANDTDPENDIDPTTVMIQSGPSNGSVAVDPVTGEVTYTPDGDYNGPDSFTYTVKDATGLESNVATVNITVDPVADKPVTTDDNVTTDEDVAVTIDVLANDTDPENDIDPTTVVIQSGPSNGSVAVDPVTGEVTYTPDGDYNGPDSFTYTVKDATGLESNVATVNITVEPVADKPVAADDNVTTDEDVAVTIDVLANDTDPENDIDPTTVMIQSGPSNGSVAVDPVTGEVTYTPDGDYNGPDSFTYTVKDATGLESNVATVNITVDPVADPPLAADDSTSVKENSFVEIDVLNNDTDPENDIDPTTVVIQSGPANGSVSVDPVTGEVTYTPDADYFGADSFTYTVKDATGLESNAATVTIDVEEDYGVTIDFTGSNGLAVYDVGLLSVADSSETANGSFKVTAQDGLASVTIAGVTFTAVQLATASAISPLTVVSNADEELVITGYNAGTGDISYSYTLLNPVDHDPGSDIDSVSFIVTATDSDGDSSAPGSLTISQIDDKPEILSVSDGSGINGAGQIVGAISVDSSADSPESFSWGTVSTSVELYANDEPVIITTDNETQTITGKLADDTTVFTLTLNDDLSTYTYHQYMAVQTVASEIGIASNLSGGNSDSFRLSSNGALEDPIQTLFYGYEFDDDTNEYVLNTVNTTANTMGVGTGQDVDSDAGQEDQLLMHFDKNVTSMSLQVDITGNNTAELRYTIYSVKPSEFDNLGVDGFTYDDLPAGGISNVVTVSNGDTVVINASDLGLDEFTFIVFEADDGEYKLVPNELTVNYLTEAQDFSISSDFNVTDSDQDTATDTININVSGTADDLTGDGDNNALGGNEEANVLTGLAGDDQLSGNDGDDTLIGGAGNDTLIGGLGSDTFVWTLNDGGAAGAPANDVIADFDASLPASGGDVLDISTLLVGEDGGDLTHFLHFELNGEGDTELHISTDGDFAGGYNASDVEQVIVMENVDLVSAYTVNNVVDQSSLIQDLVTNGTLITDV